MEYLLYSLQANHTVIFLITGLHSVLCCTSSIDSLCKYFEWHSKVTALSLSFGWRPQAVTPVATTVSLSIYPLVRLLSLSIYLLAIIRYPSNPWPIVSPSIFWHFNLQLTLANILYPSILRQLLSSSILWLWFSFHLSSDYFSLPLSSLATTQCPFNLWRLAIVLSAFSHWLLRSPSILWLLFSTSILWLLFSLALYPLVWLLLSLHLSASYCSLSI